MRRVLFDDRQSLAACQLPSERPLWQSEKAYVRAIPMQKQYSRFVGYLIFDQHMKLLKTRILRTYGFRAFMRRSRLRREAI